MMKEYQIEETIIAYVDGRLNDADSAELLHRVSISPEIRTLLEQHIGLRQLSNRAVRNVAIRPELEESIFANIAAMREEEKVAAVPFAMSSINSPATLAVRGEFADRRLIYSLALLLLAFGVGLGYRLIDGTNTTNGTNRTYGTNTAGANSSVAPRSALSSEAPQTVDMSAPRAHVGAAAQMLANTPAVQSLGPGFHNTAVQFPDHSPTNIALNDQGTATIGAVSMREAARPNALAQSILIPQYTFRNIPSESGADFELGLQSASEFTALPATGTTIAPFSEFRLHGAYSLDARNAVGFRLTSAMFYSLSGGAIASNGAVTIVRSSALERKLAEEVYYQHREPLFGTGAFINAGMGVGLVTGGNLISAEVGLQIPFSEKVFADVAFSLMRVHSFDATQADLMNKEEQLGLPVSYQGPDVHNTLNGRLEYGLSYRF